MSEDNPQAAAVKKAGRKGPKIPKKITGKYLYNAGLAYLQRFPSSTAHFQAVMGRRIDRSCRHHPDLERGACQALLDEVTKQFAAMGYLNDDLYLKGMITSLRGRGLSRTAIVMKLRQKGMNEDSVREALKAYDEENDLNDDQAALRLCRRKKIGPYALNPPDDGQKQKWLAALARAGFSYEVASKALATPVIDLP